MKMAWLALNGSEEGEKVLHLQLLPGTGWKPYTQFPHLKKPDHFLRDGFGNQVMLSKGYATMQHLLKLGWTIEKSSDCKF
jgi:hypothetical protein